MSLEEAETMALNALGYLADSPSALESLMDQSGLDSSSIRKRLADRDFLTAILDFLMANEELLTGFCETSRTKPTAIQQAVNILGGTP